ncbi:MAG: hypothetical protein HYX84_08255 [Chloroflexi bacterium]|nr:hypothetical protein [Chloroflexota bacterium]
MKKYLGLGIFLFLMLALVATPVLAAVTVDSGTGTGFVGKGDVQDAFGWNNAQLQSNAGGVTFTLVSADVYDVTYEWDTVTGGPNPQTIHHTVTNERTASVNGAVGYDARNKKQITGFILGGFSTINETGSIPQVGDSGPHGGGTSVVTAVTPVSSTGGLYANYGGNSVLIWPSN